MYQVVARYVSDLFASSQTRRVWSRRRAQRAGGGSEEVGGEDPRDGELAGLGLWRSYVLYFWTRFIGCLLCRMYRVCVNMKSRYHRRVHMSRQLVY